MAAFPKAAQLIGDLQNAPIRPLIFYTFGTLMNFFLVKIIIFLKLFQKNYLALCLLALVLVSLFN